MIAIPVDKASMDSKSSKLFGNVSAFALYNNDENAFRFISNNGKGDGVATAKLLAEHSVNSVVYSFMGNGPFGVLEKEGIDVYYVGKEPLSLSSIVEGIKTQDFIKVDSKNADDYLDPGTTSGNCQCGGSHD